jgi:hypothetical protein
MGGLGDAILNFGKAARQVSELVRDRRLEGLRFHRLIPPEMPEGVNKQWPHAWFRVPDGWRDVSPEELAYESTKRGAPFYAGIIREGVGVVAAGEMPLGPDEDLKTAMMQMFYGNGYASFLSRRLGVPVTRDTLVLMGHQRARALWLAPAADGISQLQIVGLRDRATFYLRCEGPASTQDAWGRAAYTVAGTWTWR